MITQKVQFHSLFYSALLPGGGGEGAAIPFIALRVFTQLLSFVTSGRSHTALLLLGLLDTDSRGQPALTISSPHGRRGQRGEEASVAKVPLKVLSMLPPPSPRGLFPPGLPPALARAARPGGGARGEAHVRRCCHDDARGRGWVVEFGETVVSPASAAIAVERHLGQGLPLRPGRGPLLHRLVGARFSSETELNPPSPGGVGPLPLCAGSLFYEVEVK